MNEDEKINGKTFNEFLDSLDPKLIEELNQKAIKKSKEDYDRFLEKFRVKQCSLCGTSVDSFDRAMPCLHWLIYPDGMKSKDISVLGDKFGLRRLQSYLRWVASSESVGKNINDLVEEGKSDQVIEETIKWEELEWSISCSKNDFNGHDGSGPSSVPHYHLQVRKNEHVICRYNQHHLPLTNEDYTILSASLAEDSKIKFVSAGGPGMQELMDVDADLLLQSINSTDSESEATFHLETIIVAEDDHQISEDQLQEVYARAERENIPLAVAARDIPNVSVQTVIAPGPGVANRALRSGGRGSNRKT